MGQLLPVRQFQHHPQMGHGHHVIAHLARIGCREGLSQMQAQLMSEKVEIDPAVGTASFGGPQQTVIKFSRLVQIPNVVR